MLRRDGEALEEQDEDEQVVDGDRPLQQVSREELQPGFAAVPVPEPGSEGDRQGDPEHAPSDRFAEPFTVTASRRDEQVEAEQREDAEEEERPQLGRVDVTGPCVDVLVDVQVRLLRPRGVAPLLRRMTSLTGTWSRKRSRNRLRRKRR